MPGVQSFFEPWPALAPYGKILSMGSRPLFYYDLPAAAAGGGPAKPVLVLIHGLGDEADTWRHVAPILAAAGYRVLAPDLCGFGRSTGMSPPNAAGAGFLSGISLKAHAGAVLELLAAAAPLAGQHHGAALVGSSMGAVIAELAAFNSDAVDRIILLDGPPGGVSLPLITMALPFIGKKWYRSFRTNPTAAWQSLSPYYADIEALDETDKAFLKSRVMDRVQSPSQERAYFASLRSLVRYGLFRRASLARQLAAWPGRVHLVWGKADTVIPLAAAEAFRKNKPGTDLTVISGAGHLPHQEKPSETARAILDFLTRPK